MPHSDDRTLITCAGDSQVRVFDIEYSSSNSDARATSAFAASARSRRFNDFFEGVRYLSEGNTNARVYRSHADRVKRIVTESSPYLFLTCSEDGEVRQWDLRQPSSAYPPPRGGQGFMAYRPGLEHDDSNVPPPLISYKKFSLDLNTISCSPSQPHYIALGGAHRHCFLHDRRMLGRDILAERGAPDVATPSVGSIEDEMMGKATRCVRRFGPRGKRRMRHLDDGHITACKISDANPDEMIVSWSGDHIYSFDLIRSPDAREGGPEEKSSSNGAGASHTSSSRKPKRKRPKPESTSSQESGDRHHSRRRPEEPDTVQVQYENGESSDVSLEQFSGEASSPEGMLERARYSVLNEAQRLSLEIAKSLVKLRQALFSLKATARETTDADPTDITPYTESFASALDLACSYLPEMDEVMRRWSYPMNPSSETVTFQRTLRRNRQASWRFVQAAGTLARTLLRPEDGISDLAGFTEVMPAPNEEDPLEREEQFGYDFLKAILLWLKGGRPELLRGFKRGCRPIRLSARFPIPDDAGEDAIDNILLPYLHGLAGDIAIVNVDASRFEHDASRIVFQTQIAAVTAFGNAVRLPLEDLGTSAARIDKRRVTNPTSQVRSLDRASATRFWVLRVGRGVLMEAGNGVNYAFVNRAFGGLRTALEEPDSDMEIERSQDDAEANEEEELIGALHLVRTGNGEGDSASDSSVTAENIEPTMVERLAHALVDGDTSDDDEHEDGDDLLRMDSSSDEGEEEEEGPISMRRGVRRPSRYDAEVDTPISSHTRVYRGHCNVKTVKDVNFFGLNDEYVVSGSDSGHLFIWDRKSAQLVNILQGDSEVVNVVQGMSRLPGGLDCSMLIILQAIHMNRSSLLRELTTPSKSSPRTNMPEIRLKRVSISLTPTILSMCLVRMRTISVV